MIDNPLAGLSDDQLQLLLNELKQRLAKVNDYKRYNRIEYFDPFPYQRKFMAKGKDFKIRYLRAGNRTGKTYGAAAEFSYHVTGRYPEWWEGERVNDGGHTFWAVGITLDSVRNVMQKELLGTANATETDKIGTGSIPRDCIDLDGISRDGMRVKSVIIKHRSGNDNTLMLYGSLNEDVIMGQKVRGCWLDEEPAFRSLEIFAQAKTRLLNAGGEGVDGFLIYTATPEQGQTPLNDLFDNDESGVLYLQTASMYDNPTLSRKQIAEFLESIPEYQRDMRVKGIPVLGTGAVFQIADDLIRVSSCLPLDDWQIVGAVDWGNVKDPTVLSYVVKEPGTDVVTLLKEYRFDKDEDSRSPHSIARFILDSEFCAVPIVVPHDSGLLSDANETNGKILQRYGVNVYPLPFRNPAQSQLQTIKFAEKSKSVRQIGTGLEEMRLMFANKKLFIHEDCWQWFKEKRSYFWQHNPVTNSLKPSGADHHIDASRYAIMSIIDNKGCFWRDRSNLEISHLRSFDTIQFN